MIENEFAGIWQLLNERQPDQAELQARALLAEGTQNAFCHALIALCQLDKKEYPEALESARTAIATDAQQSLGHLALSRVLLSLDQHKPARSAIHQAIQLDPSNSMNYCQLAILEQDAANWKSCLKAAEQGLEIDPAQPECRTLRAMALVQLGRGHEAQDELQSSTDTNDAAGQTKLGWARLQENELTAAQTHFQQALRLDPDLDWARQGVVETVKARNPAYRLLLSLFTRLEQLPFAAMLVLFLGLNFVKPMLKQLGQEFPPIVPYKEALHYAYGLFLWMAWTAPTLRNMVLLTDSFGRQLLSRSERSGAYLAFVCMLFAVAALVAAVALPLPGEFAILGMMWLGLMLPLQSTYQREGSRQILPMACTLGLTTLVLAASYWLVLLTSEVLRNQANAQAPGDPVPPGSIDFARDSFYMYMVGFAAILYIWTLISLFARRIYKSQ